VLAVGFAQPVLACHRCAVGEVDIPHRADEVADHVVDLTELLGARQRCARMIMSLKAIVQLLASLRYETRNLVDAALAVGACPVLAPRCLLERGSALAHGRIVARVICV